MKCFVEDDVEYAMQMAKLNLHQEVKENEPCSTTDSPNKNMLNPSYSHNTKDTIAKPSKSLNKRNFREGRMRIQQIVKYAYEIKQVLEELYNIVSCKVPTTFVSPLEASKRQKQWEEFYRLTRRSLFGLRREVQLLSQKVSNPLASVQDSSLRQMSSVCRSCLLLLQGLKKYSREIVVERHGNALFKEISFFTHQIFLLLTVSEISVPDLPRILSKTNGKEISLTEESPRSIEIDSDEIGVVQHFDVSRKTTKMARQYFKKRKLKNKKDKSISPLKRVKNYNKEIIDGVISSECSRVFPIVEELDNGRTVHVIHDSLSPKMLRKNRLSNSTSNRPKQRTLSQGAERMPEKTAGARQEEVRKVDDKVYGLPEEMADGVFARLLPFIKEAAASDVVRDLDELTQEQFSLGLQRKLDCMQERLEKVEETAEKIKTYLKGLHYMDLDGSELRDKQICATIDKANRALMKTANEGCSSLPCKLVTAEGNSEDFGPSKVPEHQSLLSDLAKQKMEFWQSLSDANFIKNCDNIDKNNQNLIVEQSENKKEKVDKEIQATLPSAFSSVTNSEIQSGSGIDNRLNHSQNISKVSNDHSISLKEDLSKNSDLTSLSEQDSLTHTGKESHTSDIEGVVHIDVLENRPICTSGEDLNTNRSQFMEKSNEEISNDHEISEDYSSSVKDGRTISEDVEENISSSTSVEAEDKYISESFEASTTSSATK